jgi:acetyl esterase
MPLHPQARTVLDAIAAMNAPELCEIDPVKARELTSAQRAALPPGPDALVEDRVVPGPAGPIAVRTFRPQGTAGQRLPALVWFHGGGFVIGSVPESDADCRHLSTLASVAVISIEYRLAPEHPFPAATDDCFAATSWVAEHAAELGVDPNRIAVGGDSAGGNLAAVVALMARDRGAPRIRFQLHVYPVTDLVTFDTPSYTENADGYFLTKRTMHWFRDHYAKGDVDRKNPYASPLHADLRFLPPAFVVTAEFDPLRDEGERFAERLERAGNVVTLRRYDGMIHGFFSMNAFLDDGKRVLSDCAAAVKDALRG